MKRGLLIGFLLGFMSVSIAHAELSGYMGALERIVVLMEQLIQIQKGIATDIHTMAGRHARYSVEPSDGVAR